MFKESLLRTYARAHLLRRDRQRDAAAIDAFMESTAFLHLASGFDRDLESAMIAFKTRYAAGADNTVEPAAPLVQTERSAECAAAPVASEPGEPPSPTESNPPESSPMIAFRLPNARMGSAYSQRLDATTPQTDPIIFIDIAVPPELALQADLAAGTLSGTPPSDGEFDIAIVFEIVTPAGRHRQTASVTLLVNPDPKLMWKDLPSDRAAPYWKPDAACASLATVDFRVVAASKRGRSHAHVGSFRDDDFLIDTAADTVWVIAIVADGAGSARYSRRGAHIICEQAGAVLKKALDGPGGDAVTEAADALHRARSGASPAPDQAGHASQRLHAALVATVGAAAQHAVNAIDGEVAARAELQAGYRDFCSTAIISASRRFAFGTLCVAYWVGDGAVGVYDRDAGIALLGDADSGEFSGQTRFLEHAEVSPEAIARRTRFALVADMTALILMSDGVSDAKFDTEANLSRPAQWHDLWQELELASAIGTAAPDTAQRLLAWLDFWSPGNHDDRTIALVIQDQ